MLLHLHKTGRKLPQCLHRVIKGACFARSIVLIYTSSLSIVSYARVGFLYTEIATCEQYARCSIVFLLISFLSQGDHSDENLYKSQVNENSNLGVLLSCKSRVHALGLKDTIFPREKVFPLFRTVLA